jgi:phospholipase/lecithinase/hemolysin
VRSKLTSFIFLVLIAVLSHCTTAYSFSALYVFGDSLSDTGRSPAPEQGYYEGRYSNGPLWVEYLSAELGITYNASNNFAVSGSTTADLMSQTTSLVPSTNLSTALFTVESGGNDFLDGAEADLSDSGWNSLVASGVSNITSTLNVLYTNGAREIIVGNLANIGQTPAAAAEPALFATYVDTKVALFNTQLHSSVTNFTKSHPGARIYLLDENTLLSQIIKTPASYGFTVTTNGALEDPHLTDKSVTGPGADYVFWDIIHPTTKVHALVSNLALQNVAVQLDFASNGTQLKLANLYPGLLYIVQTSTNLSAWSDYQTVTAMTNSTSVTLTNGSSSQTYFRVRY